MKKGIKRVLRERTMIYCIVISALLSVLSALWGAKRLHERRLSKLFLDNIAKNNNGDFSPENTVIVFDIHGVLFRPDYATIIKILWKSPYKYRCLHYALYPSTWADYAQLKRDQMIFERCMAHFLNKYPALQPCMSLIIAVVNAQKPIAGTIAFVEKLHRMGYTLHIISNIGEPIGKDLRTKFPQIFHYFKAFKTPTEKNNYKKKSYPAFFQEYIREHNKAGKRVLFIDDDVKNLQIAQTCGIEGLYFSRAQQLEKDLKALEVI
jgi:FMN phosphatase YigB (HAD superfamily)